MNLHQMPTSQRRGLFWITMQGMGYRRLGVHAYELTAEPEPQGEEALSQRPYRFNWQGPWATPAATVFHGGYVRPLCGRGSQARRFYSEASYYRGNCERCTAVAERLGQHIQLIHTEPFAMAANQRRTAEYTAWRQEVPGRW